MDVWQAAAAGDLSAVRAFVTADRLLRDALDEANLSPLHYASAYGHIEVIEFLLASGAAVDGVGARTRGVTPLCMAVAQEQHSAACALIRHKATIDPDGASLLHTAVDLNDVVLLRELLKAGADVNRRLSSEWATPLFAAVYKHLHDAVSLLLCHNADPNIGRQGRSPLALALTRGDLHMTTMLLHAAFPEGANANDPPLGTSFMVLRSVRTTGGPWEELLLLLLNHGANLNLRSPVSQFERILQHATPDDLEMVLFLIAYGAHFALRTKNAERALERLFQLPPLWSEAEVRERARRRWLRRLA